MTASSANGGKYKKINNIYLATEKDGSIEKNMAELPENPGGYSAIFTYLETKFVEKAIKSLLALISGIVSSALTIVSVIVLKRFII